MNFTEVVDLLGDIAIAVIFGLFCVSLAVLARGARRSVAVISATTLAGLERDSPALDHALRSRSFQRAAHEGTGDARPRVFVLEGNWEDLEQSLVDALSRGWAWRVGGAFTGLALLVTFFLIGYVLNRKLGLAVGALGGAPTTGGDNQINTTLASAVQQMGSKFWVSAMGIACTLVHSGAAWGLRERQVRPSIRELLSRERQGRRIVTLSEQADAAGAVQSAALQQTLEEISSQLFMGAGKQIGLLESLVSVTDQVVIAQRESAAALKEVAGVTAECRNAVASIDASLQGGLEPLINNVEKLATNLLGERAEELLARLDRSFRAGLADVITPLRDLRADLHAVSPEQALKDIADKLHGAITGGASDTTAEFRQSMDELSKMLPEVLVQIQGAATAAQRASSDAMAGFRQQLIDQAAHAQRTNENVLAAVGTVVARMDALSSTMGASVAQVSAEAATTTRALLEKLEEQTEAATRRMVEAASNADARAREQRTESAARADEAFTSLLGGLRTLRDEVVATERRNLQVAGALGEEIRKTTGVFAQERDALEAMLKAINNETRTLATQSDGAHKAAQLSQRAAEQLSVAVGGLVEHAKTTQASALASAKVIHEINQGKESMEASMLRVSSAVADLLKKELLSLREQAEGSRKSMELLLNKVDTGIVSSLATQVEDLSTTVANLEKVTRPVPVRG